MAAKKIVGRSSKNCVPVARKNSQRRQIFYELSTVLQIRIRKNPKLFAGSESEKKLGFGFGYGFGSRHYNLIVKHDKY
jgi:hypothetical protein